MRRKLLVSLIGLVVAFACVGATLVIRGPRILVSSVSYIHEQNFETTGAPSLWSASGTVDWDYTTTVLQGSESMFVDTSATKEYAILTLAAAYNEIWGYFLLRMPVVEGLSRDFVYLKATASTQGGIRRNSDGTVRVANGAGVATTVATLDVSTTYHVWFYFNETTNTSNVAFSTDGTRPTSGDNFAETTSGNANTDVDVFEFGGVTSTSTHSFIFDRVLFDDEQIGNSP